MLDRRSLVAGAAACCALHAGRASARGAVGTRTVPRGPTFLCGTVDDPVHDAPPARPAPPHGRGRPSLILRAAPDPSLLWTDSHGATPNTGRITLDVAFLNGSARDHAAVAHTAADWTRGKLGRRIAFRFGRPVAGSQIRVKFRDGRGNLSDIGTRALGRGPREATLHLADLERRSILHEFGHVLGLHHEHEHPNAGIVWNKPRVLAATAALGWSARTTEANIFERLSRDCVCIGDRRADPNSIMVYPFPADWTLNGVSTRLNTSISARDRACLEREYRA